MNTDFGGHFITAQEEEKPAKLKPHNLIPVTLCSYLSFTWIQFWSQRVLTVIGHVTAYRNIYLLQGSSTAGEVMTADVGRNEADERGGDEAKRASGRTSCSVWVQNPCCTNSLWHLAKVSLAITVTVAYCNSQCPTVPSMHPSVLSSCEVGECWWQPPMRQQLE